MMAKVVITWLALGFELAFDKGQKGVRVSWIGSIYTVTRLQVVVDVKEDRANDLEDRILFHENTNVISMAELKTLAGVCQSFPGVTPSWRPFIQDVYGVIYQ